MSHEIFSERTAKPAMLLAMAIFGTIGVMTHFIDLPAVFIVLVRGAVGTVFILLLLSVMRYRMDAGDIRSNLPVLVASGICLSLNWIFLFEAYKSTTVSTATLCNYLTPAFVILVSPIFLGDRFTLFKLGVVAVAIFGLGLVSGVFGSGPSASGDPIGAVYGVTAAVFYTGMIILNKKLREIRAYDRTVVQLGVATVVVTIYGLFALDLASLDLEMISVSLAVVMGVLQTGIAFTLYFGSLRYLRAGTAAMYGYLEPVVSLLLSAAILGETLGPIGWAGACLVLGSTMAYEIFLDRVEVSGLHSRNG